MTIKSNKGEWAEFYAFLKILHERKLPAADENLEATDQFFVFQKVIRQDETEGSVRIYSLLDAENTISITTEDENEVLQVYDASQLGEKTLAIFNKIKNGHGSFALPEAEELMRSLLCTRIKASNNDKADLVAVIHDRISESSPMLGFSIKSMVGGAATLLNAGRTTNFIYKVENFDGNISQVNDIGGSSKIRNKIAAITDGGGTFTFAHVANETFEGNLRTIDTALPDFLSFMVLDFFTSTRRTISDLVRKLSEDEIMREKYRLTVDNYSYKIRNFLDSIALGMVPGKNWDGLMRAHGGYIVVKESGEVICYHLYNRDKFQKYLFEHTRLEAGSSTRHEYGTLYEEGGELYFKLNLQIRFLE